MTDNKLTDEEIIKRLEWCVERGNRNYDTDVVLDLINRQKSEIEKLNIQLRELWNMASLYKTEGERWEGYNKNLLTANTDLSNEILSTKAEAYKEFANRLKNAFPEGNRDCKCPAIYFDDYCYIIDECCEEMVGE